MNMALSFARIICRRNLDLRNFRNFYTSNIYCTTCPSPSTAAETFEEKNARLKRPLSPHLTIYQVQLTSMLSVTHRATGIILSTYGIILGFGTLFVPGGVPCMIYAITKWGLPSAVLFAGKALFSYPLTYHYWNGIRHLMWDLGKFLTLKDVYTTGWTVVGIAAASSIILAAM